MPDIETEESADLYAQAVEGFRVSAIVPLRSTLRELIAISTFVDDCDGSLIAINGVCVFLRLMHLPVPETKLPIHTIPKNAYAHLLRSLPRFYLDAQKIFFQEIAEIWKEFLMCSEILSHELESSKGKLPDKSSIMDSKLFRRSLELFDISTDNQLMFRGRRFQPTTLGEWVELMEFPLLDRPVKTGDTVWRVDFKDAVRVPIYCHSITKIHKGPKAGKVVLGSCFRRLEVDAYSNYAMDASHPLIEWLNSYEQVPDMTVDPSQHSVGRVIASDWASMPSIHPVRNLVISQFNAENAADYWSRFNDS